MSKGVLTNISLFSGAMGLDLGLERAGFETRVAVETNNSAVATIAKNKPRLPVLHSPIQTVTTDALLQEAGLSPGEATVVVGGPCCQSFSTAGKRKSVSDPRGTLFKDFCRVVREARPRFFVMENVKGLLSAAIKHRILDERGPGFPPLAPEEELGSAFKVILEELALLDYYVVFGLLNAADYGTPQVRHRVVIIGSRDGEDVSLPRPTLSEDGGNGKLKWVSLREAILDVKSREWVDFSDKTLQYLKRLRPGQNWTSLSKQVQWRALGGAYKSWGGRKGFYRRLAWNKPSPSLTTAPDGKATMLCHPRADRPLSIEEYIRVQEFPADYIFEGSTRQKYIMIGNAVPLGIGEAIGKMLKSTIRKTARSGLPKDAPDRKGLVKCGNPDLEKRIKDRPRTLLPPPSHRKNPDPKAAKRWLEKVGKSIYEKERRVIRKRAAKKQVRT